MKNLRLKAALLVLATVLLVLSVVLIIRGVLLNQKNTDPVNLDTAPKTVEYNQSIPGIKSISNYSSIKIPFGQNITQSNSPEVLSDAWLLLENESSKYVASLSGYSLQIKLNLSKSSSKVRVYNDNSLSYMLNNKIVVVNNNFESFYILESKTKLIDYFYNASDKSFYYLEEDNGLIKLSSIDIYSNNLSILNIPVNMNINNISYADTKSIIFLENNLCYKLTYDLKIKNQSTDCFKDSFISKVKSEDLYTTLEQDEIVKNQISFTKANIQEELKIVGYQNQNLYYVLNKLTLQNNYYTSNQEGIYSLDTVQKTSKRLQLETILDYKIVNLFNINSQFFAIAKDSTNYKLLVYSPSPSSYISYPVSFSKTGWVELSKDNYSLIELLNYQPWFE